MIDGLKAAWYGLRHLEHQGYVYVWANLLWIGLTLPIITAPAAWAGLVRLSYQEHGKPTVEFGQFWIGFRENLMRGAVLALLNIVIITINGVNLIAYRNGDGPIIVAARLFWLAVLVLWFALQFYAWPLFYSMETPSLRQAFRNAAVMIVLNPLFTLTLLIALLPLVILSMVLPAAWVLLTGAALASIATSAVQDRLEAAGIHVEASMQAAR